MYANAHDPHRWSLPAVLEEQARDRGKQVFVTMVGGESLTFAETCDQAAQVAAMLANCGIGAGDRVAVMLPNSLDFVRAWAAIGRLGAVAVLLNTELSGAFLEHPLRDAAPAALIIHASYLARLSTLAGRPHIEHVIVAGAMAAEARDHRDFADWHAESIGAATVPAPSDLACIMYTSGTTGAPKGVLMPHAHCYLFGLGVIDNLGVDETDRYYICLPLYHANGLLMQLAAVLIAGGTAVVRDRFSASAWLDDIRRSKATLTHSLGAISAFVLAQPPRPDDRDHRLRLILSAPNHPDHDRAWRDRFGIVDALGAYGMTEVNIPLYGERGVSRPGTCGRPYARYFEVEIRDTVTDMPLEVGEVGEIMIRPRIPGGFMAGYHGQPEKTVEATRNFWFHTGDAGRMDVDGYITFVDRIKDCIRRRGENISAADIEASFLRVEGIAEIAAYAVPSSIDGGEDEIMLAIVLHANKTLSAADIARHAHEQMPRFAQPRYIRFIESLPKTSSEKVRKVDLRQTGVTPQTIDLEHGSAPKV
uniref:AMP-binding protein n=1 Tax=uncultured Sphingomonas sp. TaxID=158754 RepID=UPI0035C9D465